MATGSITDQDREFVETWQNIAPGTHGIIRLDPRGEEKHEMIQGERNFMLTTEERMITQDRIKIRELDPFMNGTFRPVIVPDSVTVESNPNALSDEEIHKILGTKSEMAFEERLKLLDSVATLRRMMDLAEEADISHKRFKQLEARLVEVRPLQRIQTKDPALQKFLDPEQRQVSVDEATTPSGAANPRRQRGGMSADYR